MLRHYAWRYDPDIVLLAFLSGNDVRDNSKAISGRYPRPFFVLRGETLVLDGSYQESWIYKLKSSAAWNAFAALTNHVHLLQLLNKAKNRLGQQLSAPQGNISAARDGIEIGLDNFIYFEPTTPEWREAWEITERLISLINDEVKQRGSKLHLVSLSNGIQVNPNAERRRDFQRKLGVPDLFYPERRIADLAKREGIPVLLLAPVMQQHADMSGQYLHGFPNSRMGGGHWNATGHQLASKLIADHLCGNQ
jgi:hypothetical protein